MKTTIILLLLICSNCDYWYDVNEPHECFEPDSYTDLLRGRINES